MEGVANEAGRRSWFRRNWTRDNHRSAATPPATGRGKNIVNNRRPLLAPWREAGRSLLSQSRRLLSGVGLAAASPQITLGARKYDRRDDDERAKDDEREKRRDEDQGDNKNDETKAERQESDEQAARQERREERAADEDDVKSESKGDDNRSVSRRQDSDSDANDDAPGGRDGGSRELAQSSRDDDPADDEPAADPPVTAPVAPANPNVAVDAIPDLSEAELVIESNPDVIASVSSSGGFAFARSGNVIAVSGPDGARIIQADDPEAVADPDPEPVDPGDDGGNNDMDFSS